MRLSFTFARFQLALAVLAIFAIEACHGPSPVEVYGAANARFSIVTGQEIDIRLQTIGPGSYSVPPTLTGSAIEYLEVTPGGIDPGGDNQVFHFRGIASGTTVVTFTNVCGCSPSRPPYNVIDTVTVH